MPFQYAGESYEDLFVHIKNVITKELEPQPGADAG